MACLERTALPLLLCSALALTGLACDRQDHANPLGPLDVERLDHEREHDQTHDPKVYVAPVDLELDWTLDNTLVPADDQTELVARVRIEAPEQLDLPRPPARVVLVVDTSASMRGEAIDGAKAAAKELVDTLAEGDSFSLVVFHSRAELLLPATLIGEQSRAAAKAEIEKMQAWGTTDLAGGLDLALAELGASPTNLEGPDSAAARSSAAINHGPDPKILERVVLLGDGVPNDASRIASLGQSFAARGAEITALGYGLDFDEVLLASLAEQTHGSFRFVEQPEAVASLFRDEIFHIQRTVAQDLRLGLGLGPGVSLIEVVGHSPQWNASLGRSEVMLGSIAEDQTRELIVRLAVGPHREGATVELSDLELSFTDVYTGTGNRFERGFLSATASADADAIAAARNLEVTRLGAIAQTNAATLRILGLARSGDLERAKQALRAAVDWAEQTADALEDDALRAKAKELAALEPELEDLARAARDQAKAAQGPSKGRAELGGGAAPQPFPAQPSSRRVKAAHNDAYNGLH